MSQKINKLIIIEGPDECGKTTLAKALTGYTNGVYLHSTATPALFPGLSDYHQNILSNIKDNRAIGTPHTFILDRFWPSEACYGPVMGRPKYEWDSIFAATQQLEPTWVFCFSSLGWDRYREGHKADPAHALNKIQYSDVYHRYRDLYSIYFDGKQERVFLYEPEVDGTAEVMPHFCMRTINGR